MTEKTDRHADDWREPDPLADEQRRLDCVRVRGYAMLVVEQLDASLERLQHAVDAVETARRIARKRLFEFHEDLAHAEQLARLIARDNPDEFALVAQTLETIA